MNNKIISLTIFFCFIVNSIRAEVKTDSSKIHFENALQEVKEMLEETKPLDFQRAVFVTENAYYDNWYNYEGFNEAIKTHLLFIQQLIEANNKIDTVDFNVKVKSNGRFNIDEIRYTPEQKKELYTKVLANWAIFTYLTDTTGVESYIHYPYQYNAKDPFGMKDWKNSQVINLLTSEDNIGNCFAFTALFKMFSNQLNSNAVICTAPQHIYIQHKDHKGDWYNVELATAGHPADGSIQTLTYTTNKALMNDIALRTLDEKQSVALCLVNLAKSYEHKYQNKTDDFLLQCAELVLKHDPKNLNALLLKQQVLDERVFKYARENKIGNIEKLTKDKNINSQLQQLETHLAHLSKLGYIQMPIDMQEVVLNGFKGENAAQFIKKDKNPSPFASIDVPEEENQYLDLSNGIFQEVFEPKEIETYGHFTFNTKNNELIKIDTQMVNNQIIDPVAFAYDLGARMYDARLGRMSSTDPLANAFPFASPYTFAANNPIWFVDFEGMMPVKRTFTFEGQNFTFKTDTETPQDFTISSGFLGLKRTRFDFRSTNNNRKSLALLRGGHSQELRKNNDVRKMSSVHKGVLVTELLLSALEQNPDIKLVIVGNHAIPTVQTLEQQNRLAELYEGAADLKSTKGNVTVKGEDRTFENEAEFARDRANFVKEQFFNNSNLVNTGAAQADFNSSSFPNVNIPDLGKDAVGITIVFDFTKIANPKPPKSGGGKKAPTREVYRSVRFLCFAEGTKVLMGDKENMNIENIKIGDIILNYSEALNQIEIDTVTHIDKVIHNNIIEIKFNNDEINVNTDDHPYLVKGKGWCSYRPALTEKNYGIKCQKLEVGDFCYYYGETSSEVKSVRISKISKLNKNIMTYNLTGLAKNSNYIANGVIVGNETKPKTNEIYMLTGAYEEKISNQKIKTKEKKKAKEIAQSWLNKKSDSLNIPTLQLSELRYNPDEATMLLLDDYEEQENTLSDEEKKGLMKEIEKSGFYFIYGTYINKQTNKKHTIEFVYNLNKEISYVHIREVENKDNFYFENLVDWRKNK